MSEFKNLKLNRNLIKNAIEEYSENTKLIEIKDAGVDRKNFIIESDGKEVKIAIYFISKTGETTLNPSIGKNVEIGTEIARFIKEYAKFTDFEKNNVNFSLKDIDDENFNFLVEFLKDCKFEIKSDESKTGIKYVIYNPIGQDSFTIHRYNNKNTLFQGKPLKIFVELQSILTELVDFDKIVMVNESVYKVDIKKDEVQTELCCHLPNASTYLDDINKNILSTSLALKKIEVDLSDYTPIAFNALRGLELYMKRVLLDNGVETTKKGNFHGIFRELSEDRYVLTDDAEGKISNPKVCNILNECCSYYSTHRHPLFHSDPRPEISRIIEDKQEADRIIIKTLELIERTYCEIL